MFNRHKRHPELIQQTHFQNFSEVSAFDGIVSFDEDFSQATLSNWVVLRVELVKPMERIAILTIHDINNIITRTVNEQQNLGISKFHRTLQ